MSKRERMPQKKDVFLFKAEGLKAEAGRLVDLLYGTNAKDTKLRHENLRMYRAEIQRCFILYAQLAIAAFYGRCFSVSWRSTAGGWPRSN